MLVRHERPDDQAAVRAVNLAAFETATEADLVDALRAQARPLISLVAEEGGEVIGHVMFSPVTLDGCGEPPLMGLAPLAVVPERQRRGVGGALVRTGLEACARDGYAAVAVLGHPDYYPRFGFVPSVRYGIGSQFDASPEAFMLVELQPGCLAGRKGTIRWHSAFDGL